MRVVVSTASARCVDLEYETFHVRISDPGAPELPRDDGGVDEGEGRGRGVDAVEVLLAPDRIVEVVRVLVGSTVALLPRLSSWRWRISNHDNSVKDGAVVVAWEPLRDRNQHSREIAQWVDFLRGHPVHRELL